MAATVVCTGLQREQITKDDDDDDERMIFNVA